MNAKKILICGLPGSGKTTLALKLAPLIGAVHFDGDAVRKITGNADFDVHSRKYQCSVMRNLCDNVKASGHHAIASFVCPTDELRREFDADFTIFMDTIYSGRYEDTNLIWQPPREPDFVIHMHDSYRASDIVAKLWRPELDPERVWNNAAPTAVMIGRFQPWHKGHRALFEKALDKYGQVCILVREMPLDDNNPMAFAHVCERIHVDLYPTYGAHYIVRWVPNVAAVVYGRDVGYAIDEIRLDKVTEAVSGTNIRLGRMKSGL
jgi:adenylylsulfate kinase